MNTHRSSESGNMFIYIIGAIFLMGLLVVMVRGSSTPGSGIDSEELSLRASQVQQYGSELERAVAYVLRNGHSESDIRFANPASAGGPYGDITDTPSRQIFDRRGGGATYRDPPEGINDGSAWVFTGRNNFAEIGTNCVGDSCADLIALLMNVTKDFCVLINDKNDIPNPGGNPPQDDANIDYATPFTGTFQQVRWIGDLAHNLDGHSEGCFEGNSDPAAGTYHYYRILLAR